jgi:hypothetical protein
LPPPARPGNTEDMDQQRADYGDPKVPRSRASKFLIAVLIRMGLAALATAVWIGLNEFVFSYCNKPAHP